MTQSPAGRCWLTSAASAVSLALALIDEPRLGRPEREPIVATLRHGPMMLASTGLDITVPIIIGLSALLLGTIMVGWAFLATGRRGQHR